MVGLARFALLKFKIPAADAIGRGADRIEARPDGFKRLTGARRNAESVLSPAARARIKEARIAT
jgi:hypothetical protein